MSLAPVTCAGCGEATRSTAHFCPMCGHALAAPRLNPFLFPSDTDFRFVLLLVVAIGASLFIYTALYNAIPANWQYRQEQEIRCQEHAHSAHPSDMVADRVARDQFVTRCMKPVHHHQSMWVLGGVALFAVVTGAIYWYVPAWKIRQRCLVPLDESNAPGVQAYLLDLCQEAELVYRPHFMRDFAAADWGGIAFGHTGRYTVALSGGLIARFYRDTERPVFRAKILHELAHLRNADVDKTYLTVALCAAFVVVVLLPWSMSYLVFPSRNLFHTASIGWRILVLIALVGLTGTAVLRTREIYADVRSSVWDGPTGALRRVLEAIPPASASVGRTLWSFHPNPCVRRTLLDATHRLFRLGYWDAFVTGVITVFTFEGIVYFLLEPLVPDDWEALIPGAFLTYLVAGMLFATLAVGVVGLGIWRETFAAMAHSEVPRRAGRLGLTLGIGLMVGKKLSFMEAAFEQSSAVLVGNDRLIIDLVWGGLMLISLFLFFRWVLACATTWLEVAIASQSPRPAYRAGLLVMGMLFGLWLAVLNAIHLLAILSINQDNVFEAFAFYLDFDLAFLERLGPVFLMFLLLIFFLVQPFALPVYLTLWIYPLVPWFWRTRIAATTGAHWVFLDPGAAPLTLPPRHPLRPGRALRAGGMGGVLLVGLSLALFGIYFFTDVRWSSWMLLLLPVLFVLIQIGVAAGVAAWSPRLGYLHGLCAASIAGFIMAAWLGILIYVLNQATTVGHIPIIPSLIMLSMIVNTGTLLALPPVLCVSALGGWVRRKRP